MPARFPEIDLLTGVLPAFYLYLVKSMYFRVIVSEVFSDILSWFKAVVGRFEVIDLKIDGVESFAIHPFDALTQV